MENSVVFKSNNFTNYRIKKIRYETLRKMCKLFIMVGSPSNFTRGDVKASFWHPSKSSDIVAGSVNRAVVVDIGVLIVHFKISDLGATLIKVFKFKLNYF